MTSKAKIIECQIELYQENLKKINSEIAELKGKIEALREIQYKTKEIVNVKSQCFACKKKSNLGQTLEGWLVCCYVLMKIL